MEARAGMEAGEMEEAMEGEVGPLGSTRECMEGPQAVAAEGEAEGGAVAAEKVVVDSEGHRI